MHILSLIFLKHNLFSPQLLWLWSIPSHCLAIFFTPYSNEQTHQFIFQDAAPEPQLYELLYFYMAVLPVCYKAQNNLSEVLICLSSPTVMSSMVPHKINFRLASFVFHLHIECVPLYRFFLKLGTKVCTLFPYFFKQQHIKFWNIHKSQIHLNLRKRYYLLNFYLSYFGQLTLSSALFHKR